MLAQSRHAFPHFKRFQLHLIQVHYFASLAKSAFHQQSCQRLIRFVWSGEFDVPEIRPRLRDLNRVQKSIRLLIDLRHYARPRGLDHIAFHPPQRNLLSRCQFFVQAQHSAISADQQRLRDVLYGRSVARCPRCFHGHPEADAIALPQSVASYRIV